MQSSRVPTSERIGPLRDLALAGVRDRRIFLITFAIILVVKSILCAAVPASFDMLNIVKLITSHAPLGPWSILYPAAFFNSKSTDLLAWAFAPPFPVNLDYWTTSFLFRLPILLLDVAISGLLYFFVQGLGGMVKARVAALAWFANPYAFLASELLGVPDILATLLLVAAVFLVIWRKPMLSALLLAFGVWAKFFPILLLVPNLIFEHFSGFSRKAKLATVFFGVLGLIAYASWTAPDWYANVASYSPVAQPMTLLGGEATVNFIAFSLVIFYFLIAIFARNVKKLVDLVLPTLLAYFALSSPYPQYLVWTMPLMIVDIVLWNRSRAWIFALFYGLGFAQWFLVSPALVTPSGYSLLLIPLTEGGAMTAYLESYANTLVVQVVSSAFYATILLYLIETVRFWFKPAPLQREVCQE